VLASGQRWDVCAVAQAQTADCPGRYSAVRSLMSRGKRGELRAAPMHVLDSWSSGCMFDMCHVGCRHRLLMQHPSKSQRRSGNTVVFPRQQSDTGTLLYFTTTTSNCTVHSKQKRQSFECSAATLRVRETVFHAQRRTTSSHHAHHSPSSSSLPLSQFSLFTSPSVAVTSPSVTSPSCLPVLFPVT
jgi:hypothetical protein